MKRSKKLNNSTDYIEGFYAGMRFQEMLQDSIDRHTDAVAKDRFPTAIPVDDTFKAINKARKK